MITMGSPYFVWINANEIISSWYLLGAGCVTPPPGVCEVARRAGQEAARTRVAAGIAEGGVGRIDSTRAEPEREHVEVDAVGLAARRERGRREGVVLRATFSTTIQPPYSSTKG
jgi:hypothetical protein